MSREFEDYKSVATSFFHQKPDLQLEWQRLFDWYKGSGRKQFIDTFLKETRVRLGAPQTPDDLVGAAIPKSYSDLENKVRGDAFYRAHGFWFLEEMDDILNRVPREVMEPTEAPGLGDVLRFTRTVLMDSVLLFEHWGTYRAGVPNVYGIGKNTVDHIMAFYQGARQTVYGHGSWGLSFSDNHADTATATIRQALEIRLRRAFGIMGKIRKSDDSIHPIPLSDLIDAMDQHKDKIAMPVRFENIKRINGWSNMYLHTGLKLYAWCPPRALVFLREFLLGKAAPGWRHSSKAGIMLDGATFDAVRDLVRQKHENAGFSLDMPDVSECDVFIR